MKSLKNIGLAVALLVAGSQAGAMEQSGNLSQNPVVKTVAKQGWFSSIGSVFGKAFNGVGNGFKASGRGIKQGGKTVVNAFSKKNGKKILTFSKKNWKKAAIVVTALGATYGIYRSIKYWFSRKPVKMNKQQKNTMRDKKIVASKKKAVESVKEHNELVETKQKNFLNTLNGAAKWRMEQVYKNKNNMQNYLTRLKKHDH